MTTTTTTTTQTRKLSDIANAAGLRAFEHYGSYCGSLTKHAARVLDGRTHYFDEGSVRYFGCKVHNLRAFGDRTIIATIESVSPPQAGRAYRVVVFDIDGTVIYRTGEKDGERAGLVPVLKYQPGEHGHATVTRARAEFNALAPLLEQNADVLLTRALLGKASHHEREAQRIKDAVFNAVEA